MSKKKKKQSKNKSNTLKNALKRQDRNILLINGLIGEQTRLKEGYKNFLKDFNILLGFNILQIIMIILMFVNMNNDIIFRTAFIGFILTIIMTMFAYVTVSTRIK